MKLGLQSSDWKRSGPGRPLSARNITARARHRVRSRPKLIELSLPNMEGGSILRIVTPTVGHSIRTGMSGRSITSQAFYTSIRSRACIPVEGEVDRLGTMIDEVLADRVKIYGQPFRIELMTSAGIYTSIPDRARLLATGRWQIVEAKSGWSGFQTKGAQQQNLLGNLAADALGADYVQEVPANLGTPVFLQNVELVQSYRFVKPSMTQEATAARILSLKNVLTLGELADALDPSPANGFALVCSMMVRRQLSIDLNRNIGRHSLVRSVPPLPPFLPGLFDALSIPARAA